MEKLVLIKQTHLPKKVFVQDKYFDNTEDWYIDNPKSGFVSEKFWNKIKIFQDIICRDGQLKDVNEGEKWKQLQKESKGFCNTIVEFNIKISNKEYRRHYCELGKTLWEKIV